MTPRKEAGSAVIAQPAHSACEAAHTLPACARSTIRKMAAAAGRCGGQAWRARTGPISRIAPSSPQQPLLLSGLRVMQERKLDDLAGASRACAVLARSERFELPTLGFEVRCSIQLSYERMGVFRGLPGILTLSWLPRLKTPRHPVIRVAGTELPRAAAMLRGRQTVKGALVRPGLPINCKHTDGGPGRDRPQRSVRSEPSRDHRSRRRCRERAPGRNCGDS